MEEERRDFLRGDEMMEGEKSALMILLNLGREARK